MKTESSISIGKRIKHFRELAGLSQEQLAEMVDFQPRSLIKSYENAAKNIKPRELLQISNVLGVELYKLLTDKPVAGNVENMENSIRFMARMSTMRSNFLYKIVSSYADMTVPMQ